MYNISIGREHSISISNKKGGYVYGYKETLNEKSLEEKGLALFIEDIHPLEKAGYYLTPKGFQTVEFILSAYYNEYLTSLFHENNILKDNISSVAYYIHHAKEDYITAHCVKDKLETFMFYVYRESKKIFGIHMGAGASVLNDISEQIEELQVLKGQIDIMQEEIYKLPYIKTFPEFFKDKFVKITINPDREKRIKEHFDKTFNDFKNKALNMALENDHPYIEGLFNSMMIHLQQNIAWSKADVRPSENYFARESLGLTD